MKNIKTRNFMLLLYPDNPAHVKAADLIEGWNNPKRPIEYLSIMHHDYDIEGEEIREGEGKPHYHYIVCFKNPVYQSALAKKLGLLNDIGEPETQFVQPCRNLDKSLLYLTHVQYPEKEQYSPYDLRGSASLRSRYDKAFMDYMEKKKVTIREALWAFQDWVKHKNCPITSQMIVEFLVTTPYCRFRNERLLYDLVREHNEECYSWRNRREIQQIADGVAKLNSMHGAVVGSDMEITDSQWDLLLEKGLIDFDE